MLMQKLMTLIAISTSLISCGAVNNPDLSQPISVEESFRTPTQEIYRKQDAEPFGSNIEVIPPQYTPPTQYSPPTQTSHSSQSFLVMSPTNQVNRFNNPIYKLEFISGNKLIGTFYAVTGRATTQSADRNVSGTRAPLPNGRYKVAAHTIPGAVKEVGGRFLPITPMFQTGRTHLGFHYDPSFDKDPKEDGTDGCIGLISPEDRDRLFKLVSEYKPSYLEVNL